MKKLILSLFITSFIGLNGLYAQCRINTSYTQSGFYPDSLVHATVGQAYSDTIQLKVLTDTTIDGLSATVDSIVLTSIGGLPGGFTYTCNPGTCSFPGGSNACVLLTGAAPTVGMEGPHPLVIRITVYGKIFGSPASLPDSVTNYNLHVDGPAGIPNFSLVNFDLSQNFPDPATGMTSIYYTASSSGLLDFRVYNLLGKVVYQKSFFAQRGTGSLTLDARDFAPGIYMYNLSNGKATLTKRMVMSNN